MAEPTTEPPTDPPPSPKVETTTTTTETTRAVEVNGYARQDVTMRWTALSALWGLAIIGMLSVFFKPEFEGGVMMVASTLAGVIGNIIGGKLGLSKPGSGGAVSTS